MTQNTQRCPVCGWVSITKIEGSALYQGLSNEASGSCFFCKNPSCNVDRIFGDNAVTLIERIKDSSDETKR